jgi:hypothetical protein
VGLILGGVFVADPADGYPVGTPRGRRKPAPAGMGHVLRGNRVAYVVLSTAAFPLGDYR